MKKLSELREVAIMAACVDACNRAIDFKASLALSALSEEIGKKIKHEAGDFIKDNSEAIRARREEIEAPLRIRLEADPSIQDEVDKEFSALLKSDDQLNKLSQEEVEIWNIEADFSYPVIEVPYQDFNTSFPSEKKKGEMYGVSWEVDGFAAFKQLNKMGIIKIID